MKYNEYVHAIYLIHLSEHERYLDFACNLSIPYRQKKSLLGRCGVIFVYCHALALRKRCFLAVLSLF